MAAITSRAPDVRVQTSRAGPPRWFYLPLSILGWLGVAVAIIWLASHVVHTILLVVLAALIAFALYPAVTLLSRIIPRAVALFIVYVVFLGLLGLLGYLVVNTAVQEATTLISNLRQELTPGNNGQSPLVSTLEQLGISRDQINSLVNQAVQQLQGLAGSVLPAVLTVLTTVLDVVVIVVLSIYLVVGGGQVRQFAVKNMPLQQRDRVLFVSDTIQQVAGGYIRGQVTLAAITATLVTIMLLLFGVPYAILLGVLAFTLDFIPVLGSIVSGIISVLVAFTVGVPVAIGVLIAFIAIHVLDGYVLGPRIVGRALGLNPIVTFVALLAGAELFGIWGALLAAPIAGTMQAIGIAIWNEWRHSHPEEFPIVAPALAAATGASQDKHDSNTVTVDVTTKPATTTTPEP